MKVTATRIADVLIIEPKVFGDSRGFFFESFNQRDFNAATGTDFSFVQDNHSRSEKGVLRGLHYQLGKPQGKLVRVVRGSVFDVAVDIRPASSTFGPRRLDGGGAVRISRKTRSTGGFRVIGIFRNTSTTLPGIGFLPRSFRRDRFWDVQLAASA